MLNTTATLPSGLSLEVRYESPSTEQQALENGSRIARDAWLLYSNERNACDDATNFPARVYWVLAAPDHQYQSCKIAIWRKRSMPGFERDGLYTCDIHGRVSVDYGDH